MDAKEEARLRVWLQARWRHGRCPVCAENDWTVNPKIGQIFNEGSFGRDGTSYPVVLISCDTCGYTVAINARIAGVKTDQSDDQEDNSPGDVEA
jgi:hypothetical protein